MQLLLFVAFLSVNVISISCQQDIIVEDELTLTLAEKTALEKFQELLKHDTYMNLTEPYMLQEIYLIKWLRAAHLDTAKAYSNFRMNIKWRKDNQMNTILNEDFSVQKEHLPIYVDGEDKQGRPIIAADAGQWDVRRGVVSGLRDMATRFLYYVIEQQYKKIRDKQYMGKNVTQIQVIVDLSGYNLVQHGCLNCIPLYVNFIRSFDHYPYLAHSIIVVNAPPIFEAVADLLNLRGPRRFRVQIFGNNKSEWQKFLSTLISKDQLPVFLGGTAVEN